MFELQPRTIAWPKLSGNIFCIGRNYAEHAKELGNALPSEPVVFLKAPQSLRAIEQGPLAYAEESFHHELELCLLIGADLVQKEDLSKTNAITGLGLGLDLTRRGVQDQLKKQALPWTLAKSFAGAALLSPFVKADGIDLQRIDLSLWVNGELRQKGSTEQMIFSCQTILGFLLQMGPLTAGDLIFTGTPQGVAPMKKGDSMRVASLALGIDTLGVL